MNKLEEHDKKFAGHDEKFDILVQKLLEHDKRFASHDERFDTIVQKLLEHDKKFAEHDGKLEILVQKLLDHDKKLTEHDEKFDILVRKTLEHDHEFVLVRKEIGELRQDMMRGQDEMLTILRRLDTESASTISGIKRVEAQCDQNTKDIAQHTSDISNIKRHTGMA